MSTLQVYQRYYSHMSGLCICLQCGAVPCPYDHAKEKDQRLRDLNFIVDLVAEKKRLEEEAIKVRWTMSDQRTVRSVVYMYSRIVDN